MTDTETTQPTDSTVLPWPASLHYRVTVPVTIELPAEIVEDCREEIEARLRNGQNPNFEDCLWDVIDIEPTFTVDGQVIDAETGKPVDD